MINLDWKRALATFVTILVLGLPLRSEEILVMCDDTLDIDLVGADVAKGDEVCIDLVFSGWNALNSLQFTIAWDPTVLEFIDVRDINPGNAVQFLNAGTFGLFQTGSGIIRFVWFDNNVDGETAPDPFTAGRLCFKGIGAPGDQTDIVIGDIPVKYEALDTAGNSFCLRDDGDEVINITIPTDLCVITSSCASRTNMGSLTVKPYGGMPPYVIDIPSLGVVGDIANNSGDCLIYDMLNPGSYTVIVTDDNGADTTIMVTVVNADPIVIDTVQLRVPNCAGDATGIIQIEANGGVPPYSYLWSPIAASGQTRITRLLGDVYTVKVKDSLGCESMATFDLQKDFLTADTNIVQLASCAGVNDGIIEVWASGGTPFAGGTYDYFWSINPAANGRTDTSRNNMVSGSGFVVVEDAAGCQDTVFFDIPSVSDLNTDIQIDSVICHGDSTARVAIIATSNGMSNPPYRFFLFREAGPVVTGGSVLLNEYRHDSLWAGTFIIRIDDGAGCTRRDTFEIFEPDPLDVIIVNADTSAGCSPGNDAFLEVNGFGGNNGAYTFQWDHQGRTTPRIDSLTAGNYNVMVMDRKGCTATRDFEVRGSAGPSIIGFDIQGIGCVGDTSGQITVLYTLGDTTIEKFEWSNSGTSETITGLGQGQYVVTITDMNGCTDIDTAIIDVPMTTLQISSIIVDTPSCNGSYDGFLQVNVSGGVRPYSFQWSNNSMDSILTGINAGQYIVAIRDGSNCPPVVDTFNIPEPPPIDIVILDIEGVSCNNDSTCDGRVIASASGGPDPGLGYNFIWSSGEIGRSSPDTAFNLCKRQQLLIVANGDCADSVFIDVPAPPVLTVDFDASEIIRPSCTGLDDGSITIVPQGGTGTQRVRWDFGPTANQLNNLSAGFYGFFVEDANGCLYRDSIELKDPDSLRAFILDAASRDVSCPGESDGRVVVSWRGGNPGEATFTWTPAASQDSIGSDLTSGDYKILVTDARGCMDSIEYMVTEPPAISADFPSSDTVNCFGEQLPVTIVGATGGNGPDYSFAINNGARRNLGEEINLFAGNYRITIFDKDGCRIDSSINIFQPNETTVDLGPPSIEIDLGDSIRLCFQTNIPAGDIDSVRWMPNGIPADTSLRCIWVKPNSNTTYLVEVVDENGCTAFDEILVVVNNNRKIFIPNVFNPNGNVNTKWQVFTGKGVREITYMSIYDRWGELIYHQLNPGSNDGWDGTFQGSGEIAPNDVYVYVVEVVFLDGEREIRRGDVTLFR